MVSFLISDASAIDHIAFVFLKKFMVFWSVSLFLQEFRAFADFPIEGNDWAEIDSILRLGRYGEGFHGSRCC